jgi:uncharacterized membrane protein YfcA
MYAVDMDGDCIAKSDPTMPDIEVTVPIFLILFSGGFCAGFVDSIAGGGGLIALPLLLSVGLPPQLALGTNKLQGTFGTLFSSIHYLRKGAVVLTECIPGIFFTFLGAVVGAWVIQGLDPGFIKHVIPILLLAVFFYTLFAKTLGAMPRKALMANGAFYLIFGTTLGFYDGFFGPGTGSFWTAALLVFQGHHMTQAAGTTRLMNFTSNIVALGLFVMGGNVVYTAGISMALGQIIGAGLGSRLAIHNGARLIRPIFLSVVFLTIVRLGYLNYVH